MKPAWMLAQKSVIGRPQALDYCRATTSKILPMKALKLSWFGDGVFRSVEELLIRIHTGPIFNSIIFEVDLLDKYSLVLDNVDNLLVKNTQYWTMPMIRERGNL